VWHCVFVRRFSRQAGHSEPSTHLAILKFCIEVEPGTKTVTQFGSCVLLCAPGVPTSLTGQYSLQRLCHLHRSCLPPPAAAHHRACPRDAEPFQQDPYFSIAFNVARTPDASRGSTFSSASISGRIASVLIWTTGAAVWSERRVSRGACRSSLVWGAPWWLQPTVLIVEGRNAARVRRPCLSVSSTSAAAVEPHVRSMAACWMRSHSVSADCLGSKSKLSQQSTGRAKLGTEWVHVHCWQILM
jgi:hypothetical protein